MGYMQIKLACLKKNAVKKRHLWTRESGWSSVAAMGSTFFLSESILISKSENKTTKYFTLQEVKINVVIWTH